MENKAADNVASAIPANVDETGSIATATEALLNMLDAEDAPPATDEGSTPDEEVEAQPEEDAETEDTEVEEDDDSDEDEYDPDDEPELEGDDVEDVYTVKVDGTDTDVTLDELLAGYSRHSDYTKKTQQISEERKQIEQMAQAFQQELQNTQNVREQYVNQIGQYVQQSLQGLQRFAGVDWARLKEEDPIEYVTRRDEFREEQNRIGMMQQQQQRAIQENERQAKHMHSAQLQEETQRLAEIVPEWTDDKKRPELAGQMREFARSSGYSDEEIDSVIDHRAIGVLLKAAKYDALTAGDLKKKRVKRNPKLVRAGSKKDKSTKSKTKRKAQMNRLAETGSYKDAAKLMEDLI